MAKIKLETNQLYLGIDFGTTNSIVSMINVETNEVTTIPIEGSNIFPTAIQFEKDYENENKLQNIFGSQAKESAIIYPQSTVLSIKSMFGVEEKVEIIVDDEKHIFTPTQIAGEILGYIKRKADEYVQTELNIDGEFTGCVITTPANSTDKQKRITKNAGIIAGFDEDKIHIRPEPVAAAFSYAMTATKNKKVLVYDFGGGTFDACILDINIDENKEMSILSTFGDNNLGGNDVDKILLDILYEKFKELTNNEINLFDNNDEKGISVQQKKMTIIKLMEVATSTKEKLSSLNSVKVVIAPLLQQPQIVNLKMEITKEQFLNHKRINKLKDSQEIFEKFKNKSVTDIINMTINCTKATIDGSSIKSEDIDEIFLVGGSSALPLIYESIEKNFNISPYKSKINPALSISIGAAYYSKLIYNKNAPLKIVEKTIHSLGIEISGRRYLEVVQAGVEIGEKDLVIECEKPLLTNFDDVTSMVIVVYENTNPKKGKLQFVNDKCMKRLGGTTLKGIPKNKKALEEVKLIFEISKDNILTVKATSLSSTGVVTNLVVDNLY